MFNDLREFIKKTEEIGEYKFVEGADWDLEIGAISEIIGSVQNSPLLLFDRIKGYKTGYQVASNIFNSLNRTAMAFGIDLHKNAQASDLVNLYRKKIKDGFKLIQPIEVDSGPVKENVITGNDIDLFKFPSPRWNELDGGRFIGTGSITITRDLDEGWINLGTYRVQVFDKTNMGANVVPGHHMEIMRKKYWEKGQSCPAVVVCGQEPILFVASQFEVPWGVSEYDFAGGLKNKPIEVTKGVATDLLIPATAEIAIEGEILPPEVETRKEGPFGEWPGYYAKGVSEQAVMKVTSILHRNNPIIQGCPPAVNPAIWSAGRHIQVSAALWDELDGQIPGIKGVYCIPEATSKGITVVSLKQMYGGHAKQAGLLVAGSRLGVFSRFIIVVDDDIDPSNISELLWALGTRLEPDNAIEIIKGCFGMGSNPALPPERRLRGDFTHSIAIILACRPYEWIKEFPPVTKCSKELINRTKKKFAWLFSG